MQTGRPLVEIKDLTMAYGSFVVMRDIMVTDIIVTTVSEDLNTVLQKLTIKNIDALPVVKEDDHGVLLGILYRRDVISHYNHYIKTMRKK